MCLNLSVDQSVHKHISETAQPNFTKFSANCCLLPWLSTPLAVFNTSSVMDDITFSYNGYYSTIMLLKQPWCNIALAPLLSGMPIQIIQHSFNNKMPTLTTQVYTVSWWDTDQSNSVSSWHGYLHGRQSGDANTCSANSLSVLCSSQAAVLDSPFNSEMYDADFNSISGTIKAGLWQRHPGWYSSLYRQLQSVMNAGARLVCSLRFLDHISNALVSLC